MVEDVATEVELVLKVQTRVVVVVEDDETRDVEVVVDFVETDEDEDDCDELDREDVEEVVEFWFV